MGHDERERPHVRGWSKEEWWRGTRLHVRPRRRCVECVAYKMRCRSRAASLPSAQRVEFPDGGRSEDHDRWGGTHVQRFPHRQGSYSQGFDHYNNWWVGSSRCLSTTAELGQVMNCDLPLVGCGLSFHYTGDSDVIDVKVVTP